MKKPTGLIAILAPVVAQASGGDPTLVGFRNDGTGHYQGRIVDRFDLATSANIRRKADLPDHGVSSPMVVRAGQNSANGGLVIVTCDPDRVIAYRLADGKQVWNEGTSDKGLAAAKLSDGTAQDIGCAVPRSSRGPFLQPSPAVAGDRMVLADQDGTVTVVDKDVSTLPRVECTLPAFVFACDRKRPS